MGIQLDWQVESEQSHLRATEDPEARQRRHQARRRLIVLVLLLACLLFGVIGTILWRLRRVENHYRQDLIDTVQTEITALRIGDYANFMAIQRSASDAFLLEQSHEFEEYQQLKLVHRVDLTGTILDVKIDNLRGRVVVQEIIDGVPYKVVWFYWYYEDSGPNDQGGWRRVPDDLTFWGESRTIKTSQVRIDYHALDDELAQALLPLLDQWWVQGCTTLQCTAPPLKVEIVAERPTAVTWSQDDPWTLRITSPLTGRMRDDVPVSPELKSAVAEQVAARLVRQAAGDLAPKMDSDAAWLMDATGHWLAGKLIASSSLTVTDTGFVATLVSQYGTDAPVWVLHNLRSDTTLDSALAPVMGVSLPLMTVDQISALNWQDFFQWRLELESRILVQPDSTGSFLSLYDMDNPTSASQASLRLEDPAYAVRPIPQVNAVAITRDANAQTYAYVDTSRTENGQTITEIVIWRLVAGTWKRVN